MGIFMVFCGDQCMLSEHYTYTQLTSKLYKKHSPLNDAGG